MSVQTGARVELTRNQVELFTNGQSRRAQVSDVLGVNDALSTARRARAELRFNDGSLARIGESAVFQFTPNTRNFRLSNGTVLLLIPPGQGRTTIQTPNAVTGIHGSALFVRFVPETETTIIGALTNNPDGAMMVFNQDGSQQQPLYAGEMAVLRGNRILERFSFDLKTFYETSDLIVGLQLDELDVETGDAAIDAVRQEIQDALEQQQDSFEEDSGIIENPPFLSANSLQANAREPLRSSTAIPDFSVSPAAAFLQQNGIGEGFESVVSATVNQPAADQVPPTTGQPNPQPPVAKPPGPNPAPPAAAPPTKPTEPIAPVPNSTNNPPITGPTPGETPNQPVEKPPVPVIPEANNIAPIAPESAPAPNNTPITTPPESTVPTNEFVPSTEKPPVPLDPFTPNGSEEVVIPANEPLGELNLIETVPEPETEIQVDRLATEADAIPVQVEGNPGQSDAAPPPGQSGANPGQSGAPPPGQSGANPGQSGI
jgi:acrosin